MKTYTTVTVTPEGCFTHTESMHAAPPEPHRLGKEIKIHFPEFIPGEDRDAKAWICTKNTQEKNLLGAGMTRSMWPLQGMVSMHGRTESRFMLAVLDLLHALGDCKNQDLLSWAVSTGLTSIHAIPEPGAPAHHYGNPNHN